MAQKFETLSLMSPAPHILCVTLDRPQAANAFNTQMAEEIASAFAAVAAPGGLAAMGFADIRCIILTGAGTRSFCAGADLKERNSMTDAQWLEQHAVFERMFLGLMDCPLPLIAAVNGAAFGGGCEIVLCCDFVYAAHSARFALTETSLGIIPGGGATQNLPRCVGIARAKEILFSATPFSAEEALSWGLVNRLCEPETLMKDVLATAAKIGCNAPFALRQAKEAVHAAVGRDRHSAYAAEIEAYNRLIPTEDRYEGIRAYNEKRRPHFKGR